MSDQPAPPSAPAWLQLLAGLPELRGLSASPVEQSLLLDLARVAARRSERTAAPITTYLAGMACASLEAGERVVRLRAILAAIEAAS